MNHGKGDRAQGCEDDGIMPFSANGLERAVNSHYVFLRPSDGRWIKTVLGPPHKCSHKDSHSVEKSILTQKSSPLCR